MLRILICTFLLLKLTAAAEFTNTASSLMNIQPGTAFDITWTDASGPVTLLLKGGSSSDLVTVLTIASGLTGTSFVWTPSTTLPTGEYAFEIDDSTNVPNYSVQFNISGLPVASSSFQPGSTSTLPASSSSTPATTSATTKTTPLSSTSSPVTTSSPSTSSPTTTSSATSSTISFSTTSLSSSSTTFSGTQSPTPTSQPHHGLSTGAKAGIGVGVTLGAFLFIFIVWLAFWYGGRLASKNKNSTLDEDPVRKAELEAGTSRAVEIGEPLSEEEKELERRRRAAELEGRSPIAGGSVSERAELEARTRREVFEIS